MEDAARGAARLSNELEFVLGLCPKSPRPQLACREIVPAAEVDRFLSLSITYGCSRACWNDEICFRGARARCGSAGAGPRLRCGRGRPAGLRSADVPAAEPRARRDQG